MPIEQTEELITHKHYDINTCNSKSIKCLNFVTIRRNKSCTELNVLIINYYFSRKFSYEKMKFINTFLIFVFILTH